MRKNIEMLQFIKNIKQRIKQNSFYKSVMVLASGQILSQVISVLTVPLCSRLYTQEAYGEFGIITSTAAIIINIITLGLNSAIMVPENDEESNKIFLTSFYIQLILATFILFTMIGFSPIYRFFSVGIPYGVACFIMYIYVLLTGLTGIMSMHINRKKMNKVLFFNPIINSLTTLLITIPFGFYGLGFLGFLIAAIVAASVANIQMLFHSNPFRTKIPFKEIVTICKKYREFIFFQYPSNIASALALQMPNQLFANFFGNSALGAYSMCQKLLGYPISLIGTPINTVYFRTASEYYRQGKDVADFTFQLVSRIIAIAFIPLIIVMSYGNVIFGFILGSNWSEAGNIAGILGVQYVFLFCTTCTSYCRVVIGKQKVNFVMSIIQLAFIIVPIFVGFYMTHTFIGTLLFFAIGNTLFQILSLSVDFYCLKKNYFKFILFSLVYVFLAVLLGNLL